MQNKFYSISPAVSTEETGKVYPQAGMTLDYDKHKSNSFTNLKFFELPDFTPDFDHFVLENKANFTDLISGSIMYYGLLCSKELIDLILQFNIQEHAVFNAFVSQGQRCEEYFWLHLGENNLLDNVDYISSSFSMFEYGFEKEEIEVTSYHDYLKHREQMSAMSNINCKDIFLHNAPDFDLFVIPYIDGSIYVSQKLYEEISKLQFTGISFKQARLITSLIS